MNRYIQASVTMVIFSMSMLTWAGNPCMPIAQACMQAGYYKNGDKVGKGLVKNCVMPIVNKTKTLPNTAFSEETLAQCQVMLQSKMNARQ